MDKLLIRLTVCFTAVYFLAAFVFAWFGINYINDMYIIAFESCVCVVMSKQGKYHCKYMKYTAYGITCGDAITRFDNIYDWLPVEVLLTIVVSVVSLGVMTTFCLALHHFYKVQQLKRKKHEFHGGRTEKD